MKKKLSILVMLVVLISGASSAQDLLTLKTENNKEVSDHSDDSNKKLSVFQFKAYSMDSQLEGISLENAGAHPFGERIAKKCYLLDEKYVSRVALSPGDPASKTVIRKPVIYESVKRIERDLKKLVKKGELPLNIAENEFNTILDVALNVVTEDTKDLENAIKSSVDTNRKIELFTKRVILNY